MSKAWEDGISLYNAAPYGPNHIGAVVDYIQQDDGSVDWRQGGETIEAVTARDTAPLPSTEDREGYYGPNHFNYWASGLVDYYIINSWLKEHGFPLRDYMDFGCASGRVIRHFDAQSSETKVYGCDINRKHVDWCNANLPKDLTVFQNTSLPHLPLPENSLDLITAFSVFTHIESFDTSWLMELKRVLRPGGIAWLTIHGDRTWAEIQPTWPLYAPLTTHPDYEAYKGTTEIPGDRLVFRWLSDTSYSANTFYSYEYIRKHWGRFFDIEAIFPSSPPFQDVLVLRKPL
jgi:SAM-dependent methyltransferase